MREDGDAGDEGLNLNNLNLSGFAQKVCYMPVIFPFGIIKIKPAYLQSAALLGEPTLKFYVLFE